MKNLPSYISKCYYDNLTYVWLPEDLPFYQRMWLSECGFAIRSFELGGIIVKIRN